MTRAFRLKIQFLSEDDLGAPRVPTKMQPNSTLGTSILPKSLIWGVLGQLCGSDLCLIMFIIFVIVSFIGQYLCYDMYNGALCKKIIVEFN